MKAESTIKRLRDKLPVTIVALGDSLSYGWMVRKGYLQFLEEMLMERYPGCRLTIINRGIPGDTAEGGLYRTREDVIDEDPDCVFIQFALNDAFVGYTPERYKNNVQAIISEIRDNTSAEIVLITSVYMGSAYENEMADGFYTRLEELAAMNNLPIARVHEYWRSKIEQGTEFKKLVQFDMVHPTVEGYRLMAEAIMEVF